MKRGETPGQWKRQKKTKGRNCKFEETRGGEKEQKVGGDQKEIRGRIKSLACMKQHTHEHTSTVKDKTGTWRKKLWFRQNEADMLAKWIATHKHTWAHSISILPLSPAPEHSSTVLMRQRIKQQTERPLCSLPTPQPSPARSISGGWKATWGRGCTDDTENRGNQTGKKQSVL